MKATLLFILSLISFSSFCQVLNGSFENAAGPDLSYWQWTCNAESYNKAPTGGGNWSIKVFGGNVKGCWPGYAYQKIHSVNSSQTFVLSGWGYGEGSPPVGIYFGTVNNGIVTRQEGDTTTSTSWKPLTVQSSFNLSAGDTAVVILYGGIAAGPVQGYGYFDLISLDEITGVQVLAETKSITIFPNPFSEKTSIFLSKDLKNGKLMIYNGVGQPVKQLLNISGKSISLDRENLPEGLYFLLLRDNNKIIAMEKMVVAAK
ncbi:MAG: T9SS type A sorting domain-containing protein [Saprospiraceae bacterium]